MSKPKTKEEFARRMKLVYDEFEVKDLTWEEFFSQMQDITDPKKVMSDLGDIELAKARERMNRIRIDKAVAGAKK